MEVLKKRYTPVRLFFISSVTISTATSSNVFTGGCSTGCFSTHPANNAPERITSTIADSIRFIVFIFVLNNLIEGDTIGASINFLCKKRLNVS
jgi:hypothetical protein